MCEEWRVIEGFPEYQVSNLGRVKSLNYKRLGQEQILKPVLRNNYLSVGLCNEKGLKRFPIHRLVALTFLLNPEQKPEVDHINRNKLDNRLENLKWASRSEQEKNKDIWFKITNTGEPYICLRKDKRFEVQKRIDGFHYRKAFYNLKEAIVYRDSILNQIQAS